MILKINPVILKAYQIPTCYKPSEDDCNILQLYSCEIADPMKLKLKLFKFL